MKTIRRPACQVLSLNNDDNENTLKPSKIFNAFEGICRQRPAKFIGIQIVNYETEKETQLSRTRTAH